MPACWRGPAVAAICAARDVPLFVQVAGGDLERKLQSYAGLPHLLGRYSWMRAERVMLEERAATARLKRWCRTAWWPNTRDLDPARATAATLGKFVYISRMVERKGATEAMESGRLMQEGWTLDVYGTAETETRVPRNW